VIGLIAWLYLQAELTLYAVEINVVRERRLWPRSIAPPPYTEQDRRAFELYAQAEKRGEGVDIVVGVGGEEVGKKTSG
jgi:membrane protein